MYEDLEMSGSVNEVASWLIVVVMELGMWFVVDGKSCGDERFGLVSVDFDENL